MISKRVEEITIGNVVNYVNKTIRQYNEKYVIYRSCWSKHDDFGVKLMMTTMQSMILSNVTYLNR
jgi:hypothetical protein